MAGQADALLNKHAGWRLSSRPVVGVGAQPRRCADLDENQANQPAEQTDEHAIGRDKVIKTLNFINNEINKCVRHHRLKTSNQTTTWKFVLFIPSRSPETNNHVLFWFPPHPLSPTCPIPSQPNQVVGLLVGHSGSNLRAWAAGHKTACFVQLSTPSGTIEGPL